MGKYTKADILRMVKEDDVEFIRLQFTDIFGDLKNVAITSSQIEKHWITRLCLMVLLLKDLQESRNPICIYIQIMIHMRLSLGDHSRVRLLD